MRLVLFASAAALALAGCQSIPTGGSDASGVMRVLHEIATDPNCAHTDRVSGNLGGLTGNNLNVFLERSCPAQPAQKPAPSPPLSAGAPPL